MSRYVDIDKEIERAERSLAVRSEFGEDETDDGYLYLKSYIEELKKIPTADVEERKSDNKVYVVTYVDDEEPVVTVFNDKEAAEFCYSYMRREHDTVTIDECIIYRKFIIGTPTDGFAEGRE